GIACRLPQPVVHRQRDTAHDVAARLAVVPMVLEARGLDVTPAMLERVTAAGDDSGARILQRILDDEIRHVAIGVKHFDEVSADNDQSPPEMWRNLVEMHFRGRLKPPFNDSARAASGLSRYTGTGVAWLTFSALPNNTSSGPRFPKGFQADR
ncbi:MAG: DUF455 family protein, partial [Hyphomicrobiales bacterium]